VPPPATTTRLIAPIIIDQAPFLAAKERGPQRSHVILLRPVAAAVTVAPRQPVVQDPVEPAARRRLSVRGGVIGAPVQAAAASAGGTPATPRLIAPIVQSLVDEATPRRHVRGAVIAPRWSAYIQTPAVTVTPPRTMITVQADAPPRQHRHGAVITGQVRVAPVVPARPVVVAARPVSSPQRRRGCVISQRRVTAPVTPPRPVIVRTPPRRRGAPGHVLVGSLRFASGATPSAVSVAALTGYVNVGAQDGVTVGATGQPGVGASASETAGGTGQPGIGGSGFVNL